MTRGKKPKFFCAQAGPGEFHIFLKAKKGGSAYCQLARRQGCACRLGLYWQFGGGLHSCGQVARKDE